MSSVLDLVSAKKVSKTGGLRLPPLVLAVCPSCQVLLHPTLLLMPAAPPELLPTYLPPPAITHSKHYHRFNPRLRLLKVGSYIATTVVSCYPCYQHFIVGTAGVLFYLLLFIVISFKNLLSKEHQNSFDTFPLLRRKVSSTDFEFCRQF